MDHKAEDEPLTEVQIGILSARASGKTRKEIAYSLGLSLKTVEYHFARIYRFLDVSNDIELTHYAIHNGLIPLKQFPSKRQPRLPGKVRVQKNA
jgi:DNA-binding NarL/FixJ family response regulator